ncbi:MAG: hypothetical protein QNJ46_03760 [Leptolyngbyaceae cyanobacterium MO_188.B28]|nr:hypothetical protein [Leptolyngbyaceae cyanobacterium MO_188.B28]
MNSIKVSRIAFAASGIYDLFLGIVFLLFPLFAFDLFNVTHPNHLAYVQFPASLLLIFAIMYFNIAKDPVGKISFMPYGILLKVAYSGIVFWYWLFSEIPDMWKPFAIIDLLFIVAFGWCYSEIRSLKSSVS